MRKVILLSFLIMGAAPAFSQITTLSDAELGFGLETAVPMGTLKETHKTGLGGSVKFAYTIPNTNFSPSFQAGFISFKGQEIKVEGAPNMLKESYPSYNFIPLKFGLRYNIASGIYAEPQLGASVVFSENYLGDPVTTTGATYALNVGFQTLPGIDISARYEGVSFSNSSITMVGIRLAYHFTFRRQEIY